MALATYADLCESVANWLNRSDLSGVIPDFIALAESRMARDLRLMSQITSTTVNATPGSQNLAQPAGVLEYENLSLTDSGGITRQLVYMTVELMNVRFPDPAYSGVPTVYSIEGPNILLGPNPDAAYPVALTYYKRFASLATASTNWLLTNYPSLYLHLSLMNGAMYLKDKQGAQDWESLYVEAMTSLQKTDQTAAHSGSELRVRAV